MFVASHTSDTESQHPRYFYLFIYLFSMIFLKAQDFGLILVL